MPWKTLCGFAPTKSTVTLLVPNGAWRTDTVITDTEGTEYFVLLEMDTSMRTYEAVFADIDGNKLVCVKRHIIKAFWKDGYYFCTYRPNYQGQKHYLERDIDGRKIYPHSYLELNPMKGRFFYRFLDDQRQFTKARLSADNPWLGFMMGCCTCCMRCGRFTGKFKKRDKTTQVFVDQWRNTVKVAPNNDLLAALCMAYVFDKCQNQPMVTMIGDEEGDYGKADEEDSVSSDSDSSESADGSNRDRDGDVEMHNMDSFRDEPQRQKQTDNLPTVGQSGNYPDDQSSIATDNKPRHGLSDGRSVGSQSMRSRNTQQTRQSQR